MAQIFVNLPAPTNNGSGAAVDTSAFGPLKSITIPAGALCTVVIEMSNDLTGVDWAPVWVFPPGGGHKTVELACRWMRATVQAYIAGTPEVDVGGTNEGATFVQLVAPAGDGAGAAVDVSGMGLFKTIQVAEAFRGSVNIEVSEDGTTNWAQVFSFLTPGSQTMTIAAHHMRVTRQGVPTVSPGLPIVFMGAADPQSGDRGIAISAGTQSVGTGTVVLSNSNGLSFGMSGSNVITASMDAFRSIAGGGSTATGSLFSFVNSNGVTFGVSGGSLTASVQTVGGTATGVGISAGTQVATTGAVIFSNSNGISFGLNNQTLSATYVAIRTISAGTQSVTNGQVSFADSNNISFGMSASTVTASVFQPAVQRTVGFTATGGETRMTVTFTPAAGSSNYGVFPSLAGVASIFGMDIASSLQSVSAFVVEPTASLASNDAIKFFLFQST